MRFDHYLSRLHESPEFKKFKGKNKNAYLAAGFFLLDYETGKNTHQIDYVLPNGKIATFILDEGIQMKMAEQAIKKKLPELKTEIKTDIDALKGIVEDEMKNRIVTEKIKKIIAVLHILDNKVIWNLQCILDGLGILNVHVDDSDRTVLKFEKHSLLEFIKTSPQQMMMPQMPGKMQPQQEEPQQEQGKEKLEISKEDEAKLEQFAKQLQKKIQQAQQQAKKKKK